jgi:tight adherence protein C
VSPIVFASIILFGIVIGAAVYFLLSGLDKRDRFKQTMKRAQGQISHDERESTLSQSFTERVFRPISGSVVPFMRSKTPAGYIDKVRVKMIRLGKPDHEAVDKFLAARLLSLLLIPALILFFLFTDFLSGLLGDFTLLVWLLVLVIVLAAPDVILTRLVDRRQALIQQQLPDILDLLTISVEAGLGPFSEEMNRMLGESRSGMSRAEALRALDQRVNLPDVKSFVMAILQADKFGVPIGRVLRMQADEMRIKRRQEAQDKAQKAPVKILMPTVLCIFPVLFIVVLGPAVIRIIESFV